MADDDEDEAKSACCSLTRSLSLCLQPLRKGVNWPMPAEATKKDPASDQCLYQAISNLAYKPHFATDHTAKVKLGESIS